MTLSTEANSYLAKLQDDSIPVGTEQALQVLLKPMPNTEPLHAYDQKASYLSPDHCRLCFQGKHEALSFDLAVHLRAEHDLSMDGYRQRVLQDAMTYGLRPVPNQLLRTRLAQYRQALTKERVAEGVCAACARAKRHCKLTRVQIGNAPEMPAPAWLLWPDATWRKYGLQWLERLDQLLGIDAYWRDYFEGPARLELAHRELDDAIVATATGSNSTGKRQRAEQWLARVELWSDNIQRALREDSVLAPPPLQSQWLLYPPAMLKPEVGPALPPASLTCDLCNKCLQAFRQLDADGIPTPSHSFVCRARGLWAGPEPEPIRNLTWAGRRVLQLGRAVVCIKTVSRPFPGMVASVLPQYTTGNVHAFPQKTNEISRALGLLPLDLCCDIAVQFPTSQKEAVAQDRSLRISIQELRDALWWYCTNNWEWMVATRNELPKSFHNLGTVLEHLLAEYAASLSGGIAGVPQQLQKTATEVHHTGHDPEHLGIEATTSANPTEFELTRPGFDSSAVSLDAGMEDNSPLGLWNAAISKYSVLTESENRLLSLTGSDQLSSREELEKERVGALLEAIHALRRLGRDEVRQQLMEFEEKRQVHELCLSLPRTTTLLNAYDLTFWAHCFSDLFYRADCWERHYKHGSLKAVGRRWMPEIPFGLE